MNIFALLRNFNSGPMVVNIKLAAPHSTLVPNTADRGSGVGHMSPNLKTKGGMLLTLY